MLSMCALLIFLFVVSSGGSLFTNSNWFAFEDDRTNSERITDSLASSSPNDEETGVVCSSNDEVNASDDLNDTATSDVPESESKTQPISEDEAGEGAASEKNDWVEWRETSNSSDVSDPDKQVTVTNGIEELGSQVESCPSVPQAEESSSTVDASEKNDAVIAESETGVPQSSPSSNSPEVEVQSSGDEQIPMKDEHEKN